MKKCSKCKIEKEESEFHKNKKAKDGLQYICKKCKSTKKVKEVLPSGQKRCSSCKQVKSINEFTKNSSKKDKLSPACKQCQSEHSVEIRNRSRDKKRKEGKCLDCGTIKEDQTKVLCEKCRNKKVQHDSLPENKEKKRIYKKQYYQQNRDKVIQKHKEYYNNPENQVKIKEYTSNPINKNRRNRNRNQKYANDTLFKIVTCLRRRLWSAIKNNQKSGSAIRDLGCSIEECKIWLENQFLPGMTWDNWGNGENDWQIDHVFPFHLCNLTNREDMIKVCHYTNLRPLWRKDNISRTYEEFKDKD